MVAYRASVDVPDELVEHVSWLTHARRRDIGSPWRKLGCFKQAPLTLAHLRKNETFAQVGAGFGVSEATAWRYVDETLQVLAAWAPGLREALVGLGEGDFVIVDGSLISIDRITADGTPRWFSRATPGRTHDLTAAALTGTSTPA